MTGKITLNGKLSSGVTTKLVPVEGAKIEFHEEPAATYISGRQTVTITHEMEGYNCYLFNCPQYGISENLFVYVRSVGENTAELYIVNSGEEVTTSIGTTMWLCLPILDE